MIVATAGHIDHGKTLLVKALTGVDGDRLPEEKRRGMTIDLGFAYLADGARTIGFIDVPGHERFIRNMLCGVAGVDAALLVVAADDGVMPRSLCTVRAARFTNDSRARICNYPGVESTTGRGFPTQWAAPDLRIGLRIRLRPGLC